jgi:hypothetical protein
LASLTFRKIRGEKMSEEQRKNKTNTDESYEWMLAIDFDPAENKCCL